MSPVLLSGEVNLDRTLGAWSISRRVDCFTGSGPVTARIMLLGPHRSKDLNDVFESAERPLFARYFF